MLVSAANCLFPLAVATRAARRQLRLGQLRWVKPPRRPSSPLPSPLLRQPAAASRRCVASRASSPRSSGGTCGRRLRSWSLAAWSPCAPSPCAPSPSRRAGPRRARRAPRASGALAADRAPTRREPRHARPAPAHPVVGGPAPPEPRPRLRGIEFPADLPISSRVDDIRAAIERSPVVIVAGETGSGKTHAAPQDLPRDGPRRGQAHRRHPAPPDCGDQRGRARCVRARWRAEPARRLPDPLPRSHRSGHADQVHDRRDPPRGDPGRSAALGVRHDHPRRGARAQHQHRLPARAPAPHPPRAPRSARHHQLRHAGHRPLLRVLRRRAGHLGVGAHLPGRGGPPPRSRARHGGERRRRRRGDHGARSARRHPGVPPRRARDPRGHRGAPSARAPAHGGAAALRPALARRPGAHLPDPAAAPHRARDQRRRDVAHHPRHRLRDRHRPRAHQPPRSALGRHAAPDRAHLAGERRSAQGPRRPHAERCVLPALPEDRLRRAPRVHRSRDPPRRPRRRHPPDEGARPRRALLVRVPRPAAQARHRRGLSPARGARRARRRQEPHRDRQEALAPAGRSAHRPHDPRRRGGGRAARGADHRRGARPAGPARAAAPSSTAAPTRPTRASATSPRTSGAC